ncbi:MAG TPA: response regulator [Xanthobacteraceae bacterium]|nr:response regulator [Xanthobacteraceae bacterium]
MTDELLSLRVAVVSQSPADHELFRQAASASTLPIETIETEGAATARRCLADDVDLVFLDAALGSDEIAQVAAAARAAPKPPFTVSLAGPGAVAALRTDAVAAKPTHFQEAKRLMESAIRVRLPSRVLVVDDSATTRTIVRKMLAATHFPLEVVEAEEGIKAIELARRIEFNIVFLDYNMPGFSGLETMAEFRREKRHPTFVLMTAVQDDELADRAHAQGAFFLKKPFFPADIEAVLCRFYGLRAFNPERA